MYGYETPPNFRTGQFLSAYELNLLRNNALALDMLSERIEAGFDSHDNKVNEHELGDYLVWKGAIRFRTGLEDLTTGGRSASFGSADLLLYINGVLKDTITPSSSWVSVVDISTGYTDGEILALEIYTDGNASKTSLHQVYNSFATPEITIDETWPGALPTFAGVYAADDLQSLSDACEYLWARISSYPFLPHLAQIWRSGTHKPGTEVMWNGVVKQRTGADIIRIKGNVTVTTTETELTITITNTDGTVDNHTIGPWSPGTYSFDETYAFPAGTDIGERAAIELGDHVTTQAQPYPADNLYNLLYLRAEPTTTPASAPALKEPNTSYTATAVNTMLNSIAAILEDVKDRIDASESFTQARAHRYQYGADDHAWAKLRRVYPQTFTRRGARLIVKGKDVILGFGAQTFEKDDDGNTNWNKYKFATEQTLISGEEVAVKTVYLDAIQGLFPGMDFFVFGDVQYVEELL